MIRATPATRTEPPVPEPPTAETGGNARSTAGDVRVAALLARVQPWRESEDREYLAPAIEILEAPPPWSRRLVMYGICGVIAATIIWSCIAHLDVYAIAPGTIEAVGQTKVVEPLEPGTVKSIRVKDGDRVTEGAVLVELDPTEALADQAIAQANLNNTRGEIARLKVAVSAAAAPTIDTSPPIPWSSDIPAEVRGREERALNAGLTNLAAALATLKAQRDEKTVEVTKFQGSIVAQKAAIAIISELVGMGEKLWNQGWQSRATYLEILQTQRQAEVTLTTIQGNLNDAFVAIEVLDSQVALTRQSFIATETDQLVAQQRKEEDLVQQLAKAASKVKDMTLTAPASGIIHASAVTTVGQVVSTGELLMQLVPEGVPMEIRAYVLNTDIGFVSVGQKARIKINAFPYTRYGTISGTVTKVATDALPGKQGLQQQQDSSKPPPSTGSSSATTPAQQTQDLVYPVTVVPSRMSIGVRGTDVPLASGMTVFVEIDTEHRRAIDYVLSPLRAAFAGSQP